MPFSSTAGMSSLMHSDIAISVRNLTKTYRIFKHPADRIKQALTLGRVHFHQEFTALQDVSFEIKKGESVGIIGRNGSGKSTLLQLICGILKPTSGEVKVDGRISALLELGSGFNPEFTGRENIYFQGAVLGVSRTEMERRFDEIAAFADIGTFIEQPVRTYSSGMFVRLAFAVIAHVDANILVIDEALAVGDVFFQQKCMRYLRAFQDSGGTILFVSHDTSAVVGLCDKAILLSRNTKQNIVIGSAKDICQTYVKNLYSERTNVGEIGSQKINSAEIAALEISRNNHHVERTLEADAQPENSIGIAPFRHNAESFGQGGAQIVDAWFEDKSGSRIEIVSGGSTVKFYIQFRSLRSFQLPAIGFMIKNSLGQYIFAEDTNWAFHQHKLHIDCNEIWLAEFSFLMPILIQGAYSINVAVSEGAGEEHIQHHWIEDAIILQSMGSRLVQGVCGLHNLRIGIEISKSTGFNSNE